MPCGKLQTRNSTVTLHFSLEAQAACAAAAESVAPSNRKHIKHAPGTGARQPTACAGRPAPRPCSAPQACQHSKAACQLSKHAPGSKGGQEAQGRSARTAAHSGTTDLPEPCATDGNGKDASHVHAAPASAPPAVAELALEAPDGIATWKSPRMFHKLAAKDAARCAALAVC